MPHVNTHKLLTKRGTISEYLASLKASPRFGNQVVHHEKIPGQTARFSSLQPPLPNVLTRALAAMGICDLYSHQTEAINLIRQREDVIVATPTASGKSLIYNLPIFSRLLAKPGANALYLFPLKALAQDQLKGVNELAAHLPEANRPTAAICDGDTSTYRRKKLRENPADIMITNPDMLHLSFLAHHGLWAQFWSGLTHIVIDEVHSYRGIFGSHMSWVLRRLQRICKLYNADPSFLLFSATVGNPGNLARDLLGRKVKVITKSGAPTGGRHFVFFNPHDSAAYAASQMLEAALKRGLRAIVYTQSRKLTELISVWTGNRLGPLREKLTAYRAGYLPEERREIERRLNSGELLGVISTSALELGIDIGALDLCIMVGYPGTIMSTWQRGGRVGRRQRESLVIMVAQEDGLDQYFMRHPKNFFARDVEAAVLNPDNTVIMKRHLLCAAAEQPISKNDPLSRFRQELDELVDKNRLLRSRDGNQWFSVRKNVHREVDLRGSGQSFVIKKALDNQMLGMIDGSRCLKECHPGAIYLHRGQTWLVQDLDFEGHEVRVERKNVNYFTRTLGQKETEILKVEKTVSLRHFRASLGSLRVTDRVTGFQRKLVRGQKIFSTEPLDLPPNIFETEGLWFEIPADLEQQLEEQQMHFMGGIHAVEHAAIGMFPLLVLCDRNDLGGISYPFHPQLQGPAVFIYDGYPGGVGLARQAFSQIEELLQITFETIANCSCETGCPSCVQSPKCGSGNRPIDKDAARLLLEGLLQENSDPLPVTSTPPATLSEAERNSKDKKDRSLPEHYCVFDIETQRSAREVGGWHRADRMGISVAVVFDSLLDEYLVFRENEIDALVSRLGECDLVVGFNNKRFDNLVLSAYTDLNLASLPTLDILEEVKNRLGYRLSLDRLAENTLGVKKSGDGLQALKWYREGRIDKIIKYCRKDVKITRDLLLFGREKGYLLFRNKAGKVVRCPVTFS
ncbi:MAG: DEAD/DEAH box helicase [Thermodesulfobacteriota bacterium]|nr:DEAD/DEAH box helicase [Thermodesulfobacteriota bacterium]